MLNIQILQNSQFNALLFQCICSYHQIKSAENLSYLSSFGRTNNIWLVNAPVRTESFIVKSTG